MGISSQSEVQKSKKIEAATNAAINYVEETLTCIYDSPRAHCTKSIICHARKGSFPHQEQKGGLPRRIFMMVCCIYVAGTDPFGFSCTLLICMVIMCHHSQRSSVRGVGKEKRFEVTVTMEETVVLVT